MFNHRLQCTYLGSPGLNRSDSHTHGKNVFVLSLIMSSVLEEIPLGGAKFSKQKQKMSSDDSRGWAKPVLSNFERAERLTRSAVQVGWKE